VIFLVARANKRFDEFERILGLFHSVVTAGAKNRLEQSVLFWQFITCCICTILSTDRFTISANTTCNIICASLSKRSHHQTVGTVI